MTFDTVKNMIAEQLRVDPATITENSRLVDDLKVQTVGDVVRYIETIQK